jgi:hypothetical protein
MMRWTFYERPLANERLKVTRFQYRKIARLPGGFADLVAVR